MKIVEYAIRLKDHATPGLQKFGQQVLSQNSAIRQYAGRVKELNRYYKLSYDELQQKIRDTERIIKGSVLKSEIRLARRELELLQKQADRRGLGGASSSTGGGFTMGKMLKGGLIAGGVMNVWDYLKTGSSDSIDKAMERQQTQTSFNVLTGDEKSGRKITDELVKLQQDTILGGEVFGNAQTMLSFGVATGEVTAELSKLGDVSLGNKDRLNSLALVYSQVHAAGKLQGQDLLQFINAGWNPLNEIMKNTGESMLEVKDRMSKGGVSMYEIKQALNDATEEGGKFHDMLAKIAKIDAGKAAQFGGITDEFKIKFGDAIMPLKMGAIEFGLAILPILETMLPALKNGISGSIEFVKSLKPYIMEMLQPVLGFWNQLKGSASGLMDYVKIIGDVWQESIYPAVKNVAGGVFHVLGGLIEWISKSTLVKGLFQGIMSFIGGIFNIIGWLVDKIVWLWDNVVKPILNAIEWVARRLAGTKNITVKATKPKPDDKGGNNAAQDLTKALANNTAAQNQALAQENNAAGASAEKSITGGGGKNITLNIAKFFDDIVLQCSGSVRESEAEIEDIVLQCMSRVVAQGANNMI